MGALIRRPGSWMPRTNQASIREHNRRRRSIVHSLDLRDSDSDLSVFYKENHVSEAKGLAFTENGFLD